MNDSSAELARGLRPQVRGVSWRRSSGKLRVSGSGPGALGFRVWGLRLRVRGSLGSREQLCLFRFRASLGLSGTGLDASQ